MIQNMVRCRLGMGNRCRKTNTIFFKSSLLSEVVLITLSTNTAASIQAYKTAPWSIFSTLIQLRRPLWRRFSSENCLCFRMADAGIVKISVQNELDFEWDNRALFDPDQNIDWLATRTMFFKNGWKTNTSPFPNLPYRRIHFQNLFIAKRITFLQRGRMLKQSRFSKLGSCCLGCW